MLRKSWTDSNAISQKQFPTNAVHFTKKIVSLSGFRYFSDGSCMCTAKLIQIAPWMHIVHKWPQITLLLEVLIELMWTFHLRILWQFIPITVVIWTGFRVGLKGEWFYSSYMVQRRFSSIAHKSLVPFIDIISATLAFSLSKIQTRISWVPHKQMAPQTWLYNGHSLHSST